MTTLAMAAGMMPSALALGDGGEFRAPMAIAVIGGLLVSTVLSLVFVPSFFTVMDDLSRLVSWIVGKLFTPNAGDDEDEGATPTRMPSARTPRSRRPRLRASRSAEADGGGIEKGGPQE